MSTTAVPGTAQLGSMPIEPVPRTKALVRAAQVRILERIENGACAVLVEGTGIDGKAATASIWPSALDLLIEDLQKARMVLVVRGQMPENG